MTVVLQAPAAQMNPVLETATTGGAVLTGSVFAILDSRIQIVPERPVLITATTVADVSTVNVCAIAASPVQTALSQPVLATATIGGAV